MSRQHASERATSALVRPLRAGHWHWVEGKGYRKAVLLRAEALRAPALVQLVEIPPHTAVPPHYHKTSLEVFHIIAGTGSMTIDGATHRLAPGDTLTCEPPQVHSAANDSDQTWRYIVFKTNVTKEDTYWS